MNSTALYPFRESFLNKTFISSVWKVCVCCTNDTYLSQYCSINFYLPQNFCFHLPEMRSIIIIVCITICCGVILLEVDDILVVKVKRFTRFCCHLGRRERRKPMGGLNRAEEPIYVGIVPIHGGRVNEKEPVERKLDDGELRVRYGELLTPQSVLT
jgi:hypothetical protein